MPDDNEVPFRISEATHCQSSYHPKTAQVHLNDARGGNMKNIAMATILLTALLGAAISWAQSKPKAERITNGPVVKEETRNSVEISWSTDAPGSSVVKYGGSPNELRETAEEPWGGKREANGDYNHTVWVKNLKSNTTYYYRVETGQGLGTGTDADSRTGQFRTK